MTTPEWRKLDDISAAAEGRDTNPEYPDEYREWLEMEAEEQRKRFEEDVRFYSHDSDDDPIDIDESDLL